MHVAESAVGAGVGADVVVHVLLLDLHGAVVAGLGEAEVVVHDSGRSDGMELLNLGHVGQG